MDYADVVRDFAIRTRENLEFVEKSAADPSQQVYEVTQLINSMLGLLVFPQQRYFNRIPAVPLKKLEEDGWPSIKVTERIQKSPDYKACENLKDLLRYLRNSISHFNIEFIADDKLQITGLRIWNINTNKDHKPKTWEAELSIEDLKSITYKFIALLEEKKP